MTGLFLKIVNMSVSASWLVLAVLVLRVILRRAPKWVSVLMWGLVALRLILPLSIESPVSLVPSAEVIAPAAQGETAIPDALPGVPAVNNAPDPGLGTQSSPGVSAVGTQSETWLPAISLIWALGATALITYAALSYWRLRRRVATAVRLRGNIFESENAASPFVLGIIRPRIYLPFGLGGEDAEHVIAHEEAHIHRRDHWWKPVGFLLLAVHWFNPLMWLAYLLLCRDIELACDERVIKKLGSTERAGYTQALLECSVSRRAIAACPVAFGEVGVKERVKAVMNYRRPAFWIVILAVVLCAAAGVCFLTDPPTNNTLLLGAEYIVKDVLYELPAGNYELPAGNGDREETPAQYCVTADYHLYSRTGDSADWGYIGALTHCGLSNDELYDLMPSQKDVRIRKVTDAYILRLEGGNFYLVFETRDGRTYLAYGWEDTPERGEAGSDDTRLLGLYLLDNRFEPGVLNIGFLDRSLVNTLRRDVVSFETYANENGPGIIILGFRAGDNETPDGLTDLGFAVFESIDDGYRLIDYHVYDGAAGAENGIFFCDDPAVADAGGEGRNDNTYDVLIITNKDVDSIERVYRAEGKADKVETETSVKAPCMSLWSWERSEGYTTIYQYFYDSAGELIRETSSAVSSSGESGSALDSDAAPLPQGTSYVSWQRLYAAPSADSPSGSGSGLKYTVDGDYFTISSLSTVWSIPMPPGGETLDMDEADYGTRYHIPVPSWEWQDFPFTRNEWASLFAPSSNSLMSDISSQYDTILYLPLSDEYFLLLADGQPLIVELGENGQQIRSIFSLIDEADMGVAQWEYAPMMSSWDSQAFRFQLDFEYTDLTAVCCGGELLDLGDPGSAEPATLVAYPSGHSVYWNPGAAGSDVGDAVVSFECTISGGQHISGDIYIYAGGSSSGRTIYTAKLVGTGLHLSPNAEGGGGLISLRTEESETERHDLRDGDMELSVQRLSRYVFFTNSAKITVTVNGDEDAEGAIILRDISQGNAVIRQKSVGGGEREVTFTGLTSSRLYRLEFEGTGNCTFTVSQD